MSLEAVEGPTQGQVQLFRNEVAIGEPVDLYFEVRRRGARHALGELDFEEGQNRVMLKVVGRNERSTAHGLDLYRLVFEKLP